jgi:putative hemolysin
MADELSYATSADSLGKRILMRGVENLSGRQKLLPLYYKWREEVAGKSPLMWNEALARINTELDIEAPAGWPACVPDKPLVMIANHPFGIADGIAFLALAERIGRPYRILISSDLLRVPEVRPFALPIDFAGNRQAMETNIRSRAEARRLLKEGVTILIFPAGGVATADDIFGRAEDLPWKQFAVRLLKGVEATILPIHFSGQNSAIFHWVSRYSLTIRLSLLVCEFRRHINGRIGVRIGKPVPSRDITSIDNPTEQIDAMYALVHRLAPEAEKLGPQIWRQRPLEQRRVYPWDKPSVSAQPSLARFAAIKMQDVRNAVKAKLRPDKSRIPS